MKVPVPEGYDAWPPVPTWDAAWWAAWLRGKGASDPEILDFLRARDRFTISVTQGKGKAAKTHVIYRPTPTGVKFHASEAPNLLYGGAAGGAKSYTARWDAYMRLLKTPGVKGLLLRRTFKELEDNHLMDTQLEVKMMADLGVPIRWLKDERRVLVEHPGKEPSWLRFGHCEHDGDETQYLSSDYAAVYPDETATFTRKQVMGIASRLRTVVDGVRPVLRCTSNPGGAQTLWLKQWFIDRNVGAEEDPLYDEAEWAFIPSKLYDNPYLMDPDGSWATYEKRLTPMGPERARQMLEGDWDAIAGQFFTEFRRDHHVRDLGAINPDVEWFRCLDWGYNQPGCCLWVACLPDGRLYCVNEWLFRQTVVSDAAKEILRRTRLLGDPHIRYTAADGHMFDAQGHGETLAETAAKAGLPLLRAENARGSRVPGWQRLRAWLTDAPDGLPWLVFHPSCSYMIRSLPALVMDASNPEDVDTTGDDHGGDALRYGVMSRPSPTLAKTAPKVYKPGSAGAMVREVMAMAKRGRLLGRRHVRTA